MQQVAHSVDTGDNSLFPSPQVLRPAGDPQLLLIADHASAYIPTRYQGLGLSEASQHSHWGVDIGTQALCCELSERLNAPAILCPMSRLVIDCNRDPDTAPDSIRTQIEAGVSVPGNIALNDAELQLRRHGFEDYHNAITHCLDQLDQRLGRRAALLCVHSFAPHLGTVVRKVDIGVLWRDDRHMATLLMAALAHGEHPLQAVDLRENEPYSAYDLSYTLSRHGLGLGRLGSVLEIRQDHLVAPISHHWLDYLATAIQQCRLQLADTQDC